MLPSCSERLDLRREEWVASEGHGMIARFRINEWYQEAKEKGDDGVIKVVESR